MRFVAEGACHAPADRVNMPSIYLHSRRSDFAPTERMTEAAYLGRSARSPLAWIGCGCGRARLLRIPRSPWMRLLPLFRLYQCLACGVRVLRPRTRQRGVYSAVYLAPSTHRRPHAAHRSLVR